MKIYKFWIICKRIIMKWLQTKYFINARAQGTDFSHRIEVFVFWVKDIHNQRCLKFFYKTWTRENVFDNIKMFRTIQSYWIRAYAFLNGIKYLTIIPRTGVRYEVIDSRRGAKRRVGYFTSYPTRRGWNNRFINLDLWISLSKRFFNFFSPAKLVIYQNIHASDLAGFLTHEATSQWHTSKFSRQF